MELWYVQPKKSQSNQGDAISSSISVFHDVAVISCSLWSFVGTKVLARSEQKIRPFGLRTRFHDTSGSSHDTNRMFVCQTRNVLADSFVVDPNKHWMIMLLLY
mmetsp:Transcript_24211/g.56460  ORF Transcript_24211/g.56460 Transcript_24211/m.56460 type:complete len:103 (-) Transcript_24211:415-723(-)